MSKAVTVEFSLTAVSPQSKQKDCDIRQIKVQSKHLRMIIKCRLTSFCVYVGIVLKDIFFHCRTSICGKKIRKPSKT